MLSLSVSPRFAWIVVSYPMDEFCMRTMKCSRNIPQLDMVDIVNIIKGLSIISEAQIYFFLVFFGFLIYSVCINNNVFFSDLFEKQLDYLDSLFSCRALICIV